MKKKESYLKKAINNISQDEMRSIMEAYAKQTGSTIYNLRYDDGPELHNVLDDIDILRKFIIMVENWEDDL